MVLLKAQRLQRLAEKLGRIEARLSRASGEVEETEAEGGDPPPAPGREREEASAPEDVESDLAAAAARTGVELTAVRRLDGATLERALWAGGQPDPGRLWAAAEVLWLDALRAEAEGEAAVAEDRLRKARRLYARAAETPGLQLPADAAMPEDRLRAVDERLGGGADGG